MVRLSDLIGKGRPPEMPPHPPRSPTPSPGSPTPSPGPPSAAKPSMLARPEPSTGTKDLEPIYGRLLEAVKALLKQAGSGGEMRLPEMASLLEQLPETKTARYEAVLSLIERHTQETYLYSHSVNVGLLAYHLALCLGYASPAARQIALAGLLHDLGMAGQAEESAPAGRLTEEEWREISKDPARALEQLKDAQALARTALERIGIHRAPPHEATGEQAETSALEYAKILAVCDVYDGLTHPRTTRKRFSPAQAIKMLIGGVDDQFDRRVVKTLVDELSLYPKGSVVKLNTNEIGVVERAHPEAPLRPIVLVSRDAHHQRLPTPRLVNLLERPFLYIKEIVSEDEL